MREIKFRGYLKKLNRWHYGLLWFDGEETYAIEENRNGYEWSFPVAKESVGQFTGLTDKNGVEIYEGDIVTYGSWDIDIEEDWRHSPALVEYKEKECAFYLTKSCNIRLSSHIRELEVLGNIYEHPHLLGGDTGEKP